jgi:hypothetical protein
MLKASIPSRVSLYIVPVGQRILIPPAKQLLLSETEQRESSSSLRSSQVSSTLAWKIDVLLIHQLEAKKLCHIVRTPTWVGPPRIQAWKLLGQAGEALSRIELDEQENFSPATIEKFQADPQFYRSFVKDIEKEVNDNFKIVSIHLSWMILS